MDLAGLVYIKEGRFGAVPALLVKSGDELALATDDGELFRIPLSETKVQFPWFYFGGGMRVTAGGSRYTLAFSRPAKVQGEPTRVFNSFGDMWAAGNASVKSSSEWKAALR